ncbi:MAG: hypothetical protein ABW022_17925 [Actinoplanes sp.]
MWADRLRSLPPKLGPVRLVAVDGPSGAGKTQFALWLARRVDAPVVHLDDLLDGWDDQFTFWERLEKQVLEPLRRGEAATYRPYRWDSREFDGDPVTVEPAPIVVLEGFSSARREIRAELSFAVFVTAPAAVRLTRALARDGDDSLAYRAYLERWRTAEDRHFAADQTAAYADVTIDGTSRTGWDDDDR